MEHMVGDTYVVTGYIFNTTRKFRKCYSNPHMAMGINLWRGRVWQVRNGKRKLVKEVYN